MPAVKLLDNPKTDTAAQVKPPAGYRDEFQRHIDERVGRLVAQWHKDGNPAPDKSAFDRLTVPKPDATVLKGMVRRAFQLHKHEARWYPDQKNEDGTVTVKYTVTAQPPPPASEDSAG